MDILCYGRKLVNDPDSTFTPKAPDTGTSTIKPRMEPMPAEPKKYLPGEKLAMAMKKKNNNSYASEYLKGMNL